MNQDFDNQPKKSNRFIFSDEFYDKLDSTPEEEKVSFDVPEMPSQTIPETLKEEKTEDNQEPFPSFFNNIQNNNIYTTNNIETIDSRPKVEEPVIPSFNFANQVKQEEPQSLIQESNLVNLEQMQEPETDINKIEIPTINNFDTEVNIEVPEMQTNPIEDIREESVPFVVPPQEEHNNDDNSSVVGITNNFNVETGIDTALEQEILKSRVEVQTKIPIVEKNNFYEQPSDEKMVYRARRNSAPVTPIWLQEEMNNETVNPQEENPINTISSEDIMPNHHEIEIQPQVINIDEELAKLAESNPESVIEESINYEENLTNLPVTKSDLLDKLREKELQTGKISILARYGEDFCSKDYITNPAIGRTEEIKQLILILLTPEKSAILVGKPGIGKTSIVEGLAYQLQRNNVPDALKGYRIVSVKTTSLLGTLPNGETRLQTMIDELKDLDKIILFIDEIHMLMGATNESSLDFANMFKESLGRGSIKMIGATTSDEYERYILRDKAFVRRFQRIDVEEPTREQTIKILMGTLPKIEKNTGAKLKYSNYVQTEIMAFIVDITTEYKRVYGIGSRYPDICLTLLSQAFSQAVFDNRKEVTITDIRNAIANSKNIYPDVIRKELINFDNKFNQLIKEE